MTIKNAKITSTFLGIEDHGFLTAWLNLDYGGTGQGFGGYNMAEDFAGKFIRRCLEICEVADWNKLPNNTIRVKTDGEFGKIISIGNIIKDNWFDPEDLLSVVNHD